MRQPNPNQRVDPGPGQESVWDYPRPPALEVCEKNIRIIFDDVTVVETSHSFRVLETSHPPVYYFPKEAVRMELMRESQHGSFCEWKGHAVYFSMQVGQQRIENAAWCYLKPTPRFEAIAGCLAFYPSKMSVCFVDEQRVMSQQGDFYGGWITDDIVGPFKGGPGTRGW